MSLLWKIEDNLTIFTITHLLFFWCKSQVAGECFTKLSQRPQVFTKSHKSETNMLRKSGVKQGVQIKMSSSMAEVAGLSKWYHTLKMVGGLC